jgi:hypothetical protein
MAEKTNIPLPIAPQEYDELNRRTIEQGFQDINSEVGLVKKAQDPITSKAIRRHQFLLMGAKHG